MYHTTKQELIQAPLPLETKTYKPVSNGQIIDLTLNGIEKAGFKVDKERYSGTSNGQLANGLYTISNIADSEMQLEIGWQNSYNKRLTLKFAIGARIFICNNGCVAGDMGAFARKHMGSIQEFAPTKITEYLKRAQETFAQMQKDREAMKQIEVNKRVQAELVGRMFIEHEIIKSGQLNIIRNEIAKPSFDYGAENSLWELYQHTTFALKESHPSDRMAAHIEAHDFFLNNLLEQNDISSNVSNDVTPVTDPAQLNLITEIEKIEEHV